MSEGVSAELAATALALAGIRRGHVVLDLTPDAGLAPSAAAAAGAEGLVISYARQSVAGASHVIDDLDTVLDVVPTGGARVARALLVAPLSAADELAQLLEAVAASLAPGARVVVACRPGASGLELLLVGLGLHVVHRDELTFTEGLVAVAVGVPEGGR